MVLLISVLMRVLGFLGILPRRTIRPSVCQITPNLEILEPRIALAAYTWTGATNTNWTLFSNWKVGGAVPAQAPGYADDVEEAEKGSG